MYQKAEESGKIIGCPGCTKLEYLETTGTQYIDTEYVFKDKPKVIGEVMITSDSDLDIMGNAKKQVGNFIIDFSGPTLYYRYSSPSSTRFNTGISVGNWYNFEFSDKVIVDGVEKGSISNYDFSINDQSFLIGRGRSFGHARFKEIKMYDGDILVRDLIPVLNANNQSGFFDLKYKKFYYNQGEDNFFYPTPLTQDIELNYIESTGTQYIDTGYVFKNKPKVTGDIMIMDMSNLDIMGNAKAKTGCFIINVDNSSLFYRYSSFSSIRYDLNLETNKWYNFEFSDKVIVDGVEEGTITSYDFSNNTQSFFIARGRGDRVYGKVRFKEIKMYDGDELVRDLVPYYKMDINKVGMLDKVHNVFYENEGSGEFSYQ